jgi:hypothetical protein
VFAAQTLVSNYTNGVVNMWGAPGSARWTENDPSKNVSALKDNGQVLIISSGNGFLTPGELAHLSPQDQISAIALEMLSAVSTILMQMQAAQSGANVVVLPNYGGHTWENWGRGLRDGRDEVTEALRNNPPVTAKTQVVDSTGTQVTGGAAKATAAALSAEKSPSVLPAEVPATTESSSSAAPSGAPFGTAPSTATEPAGPGASTETPVSGAVSADQAPVTDVPVVSTPSTTTVPSTTGAAPTSSPSVSAAP